MRSYQTSRAGELVAESNFRAFDIFAGSFGGNPMAPEIFRRSSCRAGPCKRVEDDFIWPAQEFDHLGCQRDRHASRMGRKAGVAACLGVSLVSRVRDLDKVGGEERKSVVEGKCGSVSVDIGGG